MRNRNILFKALLISSFAFLSACSISGKSPYGDSKYLEITALPNVTEYLTGESLNLTGLRVCDKDTKEQITNYDASPEHGYTFTSEDEGQFKIVISKKSYVSTSFEVTVTLNEKDELTKAKEEAISELEAYYDSFDLSEYDDSGKTALLNFLNQYTQKINNAVNTQEVASFLAEGKEMLDSVTKQGGSQGENLTIDIYATNDIHGQIESQADRLSLITLMSYLNDKGKQDNTLLLDQGDTWQGSIYSNYNHGELITDVMNYVKYDARTVGNHDFDWGISYLESNSQRSYDGYKTPVLAANVYDYDFATKQVGNIQQSNIGTTSISYTLENGLKVGIIGTIGKDQITSITSLYTQNIAFISHIDVIKEEATKLRKDGCDIVISCCHAGQDDLLGNELEKYVDLQLCGHTHRSETKTENGLLYAQFGSYNKYAGHIQLTYNTFTGKISYTAIDTLDDYDIRHEVEVDETISNIVETYNEECNEVAREVVASNVTGEFYSSGTLPNLMCKAVYNEAVSSGYNVDLAYCNNARASIYSSSWTYADLYQAFPFDNEIYIIEVSYSEMLNEIGKYNFVCRSPSFSGTIEQGKTYKVACIDYLAFHTDANRTYDYFPENNGRFLGKLSDNYRIILKKWLKNNGYSSGTKLSSSDYSSYNQEFSNQFTYA